MGDTVNVKIWALARLDAGLPTESGALLIDSPPLGHATLIVKDLEWFALYEVAWGPATDGMEAPNDKIVATHWGWPGEPHYGLIPPADFDSTTMSPPS